MFYSNRMEAASRLIPFLEKFRGEDVVILAIPRGAVPMGKLISDHFKWPLGLLLVKKIGHPLNPEYAIGAVSLEEFVFDHSQTDIPESWIRSETENIRSLLKERQEMYMKNRTQPVLKNKTVIVVDDGIATGFTMKASVDLLRKQLPAKIVVAAPVASPSASDLLRGSVDELIILHSPETFRGVGQFYLDFEPVTDQEVVRLLNG